MEPLLKWVGGKRWQVPLVKRAWWQQGQHTDPKAAAEQGSSERRLVEPFAGGLSVTLALEPHRALLNDANPHLINFYRWCQRGLTYTLSTSVDDYYANREWFNDLIRHGQGDSAEAAQLFWYLNHFGYNGLCRFNSSGEFNVPSARARKYNVKPFSSNVARVNLSRCTFLCGDFADVPLEASDFIYADPPYDCGFTQYTGDKFTWEDQERVALYYAQHPGPVVITNHATDEIIALYQACGYHLLVVSAPRRVGRNKAARKPAKEIVASNFRLDPTGLPLDICATMDGV